MKELLSFPGPDIVHLTFLILSVYFNNYIAKQSSKLRKSSKYTGNLFKLEG